MGELGLRYRPSAQADLEEHAAALALLACDLADVPPDLLRRAIGQHVVRSPYMPKASELISLAQGLLSQTRAVAGQPNLQALADAANARLAGSGRRDIAWIVQDGDLKLEAA